MTETGAPAPLAGTDGKPAFDEPWQAEVLAIADTLVQSGVFSASEWSRALGAELSSAAARGAADNQQTYYECALCALETLVAGNSDIHRAAMAAMRRAWERAYSSTPHGRPVTLEAAGD